MKRERKRKENSEVNLLIHLNRHERTRHEREDKIVEDKNRR